MSGATRGLGGCVINSGGVLGGYVINPSASLSPGSRLFSILSRHLAGPSVASGCVECVGWLGFGGLEVGLGCLVGM